MAEKQEEYTNALRAGTRLDTYEIERVLGAGGFGVTYLAREVNLGKYYAVKELLPDGIAVRQAGEATVRAKSSGNQDDFEATRKYFISEARILAGMSHPAVVGVHRLMEANGTCYMVMDYVEGETLGDYLKKHGGTFRSKAEFERIFYPLMSGLDLLHSQGIIHRDIKPGNIMVQPDGSPVLLDFGAATQTQGKTVTITQMLSAGYSPFEQYTSRAKQGPYTDIYALGATMHKCITGEKPDDASDRVYEDRYQPLVENETYAARYGVSLLSAVDASLRMEMTERPQSVEVWKGVMGNEVNVVRFPEFDPDADSPAPEIWLEEERLTQSVENGQAPRSLWPPGLGVSSRRQRRGSRRSENKVKMLLAGGTPEFAATDNDVSEPPIIKEDTSIPASPKDEYLANDNEIIYSVIRDWFKFEGRIRRRTWWICWCIALPLLIWGNNAESNLLAFICFLANFLLLLPLNVKRLHDVGYSGHWLWLLYASSFYLSSLDLFMGVPGLLLLSLGLASVFSIFYITGLICFQKGRNKANKFGAAPSHIQEIWL
ncbi:MAG: protein kinase [Akkermansiaceae bacterium]|nr:protein kinase [Akkermansiaceae bacterium]